MMLWVGIVQWFPDIVAGFAVEHTSDEDASFLCNEILSMGHQTELIMWGELEMQLSDNDNTVETAYKVAGYKVK